MKWAALMILFASCADKPKSPPLQKPTPLEPLVADRVADASSDEDPSYTVKPFTFASSPPPAGALKVAVNGTSLKLGAEALSLEQLKAKLAPQSVVLLSFDSETYLAQVTGLLALLDDAQVEVWLASPDVPTLAWPVKLRDEPHFKDWLDEPVAGKLRIVHRADGFKLQTNMGKLAGGDPKGPTVPTRGGALDLVTLQKGLDRIKQRFTQAPDVCFMPSYGTTLNNATRAVATNWITEDKVVYASACLVYPRPPTDSGR